MCNHYNQNNLARLWQESARKQFTQWDTSTWLP